MFIRNLMELSDRYQTEREEFGCAYPNHLDDRVSSPGVRYAIQWGARR